MGVKTTRKHFLPEVIRCCARAFKRALPHLLSQVSVPALRRHPDRYLPQERPISHNNNIWIVLVYAGAAVLVKLELRRRGSIEA